jgi:hypothetical protein
LLRELRVEIGAVKSVGKYADEMEESYDTLLDRRTKY